MADYYSLISRAIAALPQSTLDARQAVYERARKALNNQLRNIQPPVAEADINAESRALEEAITRLELEIAGKSAPAANMAARSAQPATPPAPPPRSETKEAVPALSRLRQRIAPNAKVVTPAPPPPPAPVTPPPPTPVRDDPAERRETAPTKTAEKAAPVDTDGAKETQRPAAPLPLPPQTQRASRRMIALSVALIGLVGLVGALAWHMRERPEDLAKLNPDDATSGAETADVGKFGDRVEGGDSGRGKQSAIPVAQKAEMWVASLAEPNKVERIYNATVVWRLENVGGGPGEPVSAAIRGDIDVPEAKLKATLLIRKNTDTTLSASHTINVTFTPAADSAVGGVKLIGPIQMRRADAQAGEKVEGIPVPITDNNFLIGLMRGDREPRNIQLMRSLAIIDLPLKFNDGRIATINMEKGPSGDRVFAEAIDSWGK